MVRGIAFRWRDRRPPLDEQTAFNTAFSVLAGRIQQCVPFRNIDSARVFIAVVRANEPFEEIYLLEKFGLTFRRIWSIEKLIGLKNFAIADIDGDGNKEVVFEEASYGTGGGMKTLFVYYHSRRKLVRVSERLHWANAAGPVSPEVKVEPEPAGADDERYVVAVEKYAVTCGFLTQTSVDFDNPEFAAARWHFENGEPMEGKVKLHFYSGRPRCGNSVSQQLSGGGVEWTAFFKGPVFGYCEERDQHFVAYSPAWTYNWAIAATYCCGALWFVRHNESEARLYRFVLDGKDGHLDCHPIPGNPIWLQRIECRHGGILVNDDIFVPFSEMRHDSTECVSACSPLRPPSPQTRISSDKSRP